LCPAVNIEDSAPVLKKEEPVVKKAKVGDAEKAGKCCIITDMLGNDHSLVIVQSITCKLCPISLTLSTC